ncbi:LPXTG cell wall anchor domain-containing protein [Carnobacterium maltaromaticum]|uniref:LPXTG cell wall anchor domain-containing protein n=1 Tax=Carnobacterium maltaromaticum TaxID=2751 RepID=UPI00214AC39B|nr:LPXTG cell wall anchor domain-containing protein [Carnobacterium maltaromaticum]MCI1819014.1 LPXTG cell wall anchor domain-containing protein [Carnobacterium maltaromaticum]
MTDANGYSAAFDKTVLAKEENGESAAIEAIKAATVLPDIKEGITTFTGKTIPNGTVTAQLKDSKARTILSTTANEKGDFTLDLQSLNLAKDHVVTFVVTDANGYSVAFDKTVLAKEENGEAAAIAAIKAATVLPDIKEGITTFTGKTIPNGTVTAQLKNSKARTILSTTANANGDFTLDLQSLNLAKDHVVTFVVTDANGYSVTFDKTVLAKDAVTNGNGTTTGNGNNGTPTGTTNNPLSPPTVAASFPQTGEKESSVSTLAGLILLGSAAFYLTKKNKHKSIA